LFVCLAALTAQAQNRTARALVTTPIDSGTLTMMRGNTRPEAAAGNDRGRVADTEPLPHLQLLLNRPAERTLALAQYIDALHDRGSPNYEVDPGDGSLGFALNPAPQVADTDGPLPPWAVASLGIVLAGVATRWRAA
jgi:hypothetical protein